MAFQPGKMEERQIHQYIWEPELADNKMLFLSGPRQVGKTTYANKVLKDYPQGGYYNWDNPAVRRNYNQDPFFFMDKITPGRESLFVFDEIHKRRAWKDILKGIYDSIDRQNKIMVTGSARLELFRKSGDSLVGRYVHFHLWPFSLTEVMSEKLTRFWLCKAKDWQEPAKSFLRHLDATVSKSAAGKILDQLETFGGFPEPFLKSSQRFAFKWKEDYLSLILNEDLRDITNVKNIDVIEKMIYLLPERVGSPLSVNALARDLETGHSTVVNYLGQLKKLWLLFSIKPWNKALTRTVKKEEKVYFINWLYADDAAKKFENLMACSLYRACHTWTDLGWGKAELFYVRNFDQKEVDFLVVLNRRPALLVESKLSDDKISKSTLRFSELLDVPVLQVLRRPSIFKRMGTRHRVVSADRFLQILP